MLDILVFKTGGTCFCIETIYVKAVKKNLTWTDTAHHPDIIKGVVEHEGRNVPVMDVSGDRTERHPLADFAIVSCKDGEIALLMDEVIDIFQIIEKDIMPLPAFAEKKISKNIFKGVVSIDVGLILLLDTDKLFRLTPT